MRAGSNRCSASSPCGSSGWYLVLLVAACGGAPAPVHVGGAERPAADVRVASRGELSPRAAAASNPTTTRRLARGDGSALDRWLTAGDDAYAAGRWESALDCYASGARLTPGDPAAIVGVARATLAVNGVSEGVASAPDDPTARAVLAALQDVVAQHPEHAAAQLELGRILLVLGQLADARAPLERAATLAPNDAEVLSSHGIALLVSGDREGAVRALTRAADLEPQDANRRANLATAELQAGRLADAIVSYRAAVALDGENGATRTSLGTALLQAGDVGAAIPELEAAVRLDPTHATFHNNLGFGWQATGDLDRALAAYRRALALDPKLASALINLATASAKKGDMSAAREAIRRARELDPEDPRALEVQRELDEIAR